MNPAQMARRLDRIEAAPAASSAVVIVYGAYVYEESTNEDGGVVGQSVAQEPERLRLILESGQQFIIERNGDSLDVIAEKVERAYPFGCKVLVSSEAQVIGRF